MCVAIVNRGGQYGGGNPKLLTNFACVEQKKVTGFSEKFFTTWKKLAIPLQSVLTGGIEVL